MEGFEAMDLGELEKLVAERAKELNKIAKFVRDATLELGEMTERKTGAYGCYTSKHELKGFVGFYFIFEDHVTHHSFGIHYRGEPVLTINYGTFTPKKKESHAYEVVLIKNGLYGWESELTKLMNNPGLIEEYREIKETGKLLKQKQAAETRTDTEKRKALLKQAKKMKLY